MSLLNGHGYYSSYLPDFNLDRTIIFLLGDNLSFSFYKVFFYFPQAIRRNIYDYSVLIIESLNGVQ